MPDLIVPTEEQEQAWVIQWSKISLARYPQLKMLYAVPNGARVARSQANKLKREGMNPGVPDLVLPVARGGFHGFYLEMKRIQGSSVSKVQKDWHEWLQEEDYQVKVCKGHDEAIKNIVEYLQS